MPRVGCLLILSVLVMSCGDDPVVPSDPSLLVEHKEEGGFAHTFRKMSIDERGLVRKLNPADETLATLRLDLLELDPLHGLLESVSSFEIEYGQLLPDGFSTSITAWPEGAKTTVTVHGLLSNAIPAELSQLILLLREIYARFDAGV